MTARRVTVLTLNIAIGGEAVDLAQVASAVRASGADVAGLQECEGNLPRIAGLLGWAHWDERHQVLSRFPLADPHHSDGRFLYVHVDPDRVMAIGNIHLPSDPYGPYALRDGATVDGVVSLEQRTRGAALDPCLRPWRDAVARGVPLVVTGDLNSPSHEDWGPAATEHRQVPVPWPVTTHLAASGLHDAYRTAHPDRTGLTWTHGFPYPRRTPGELTDRIDYVWVAGARTVAAGIVGPAGAPDVDVAVDPWPSDHLGVVATVELEPVTPAPYVAVAQRRIERGETVAVRYTAPLGAEHDRICVVPAGGPPGSAAMWLAPREVEHYGVVRFGTAPLTPGPYDVVLTSRGAEIGRVPVRVVAPGQPPTLTAERDGDGVTVTWRAAPGRRFDWVGAYRAGDPDLEGGVLAMAHTGATVDGTCRLGPLPQGPLTLRLLSDDSFAVLAEAALD